MGNSNWIQTYTGRAFYPLTATAEDIDIRDIAHSLSMQCRFTGHTKWFYSVAEHCYHCSYLVPKEYALTALLHDASEAYLTDISRPVKQMLSDYKEIELKLESVIADRFYLWFPFPACVKEADNIMLITERNWLLSAPPQDWSNDLMQIKPCGIQPMCLSPHIMEYVFMRRFEELTGA